MKAAQAKRKSDKVIVEYKSINFKNHLKGADKVNARYCAIIGENERNDGTIWVKDLEAKTEETIPLQTF